MALRRSASFTRGVRGRRAPTTWGRVCPISFTTVTQGNKALIATLILSNAGISETIRRTRGMVIIRSDQAAADEDQFGALGMIVINDLALAAGAASIPGPCTEADDDGWFVWQPAMAHGLQSTAGPGAPNYAVYEFDSKAMRRVEEGYGIAVMVENGSALHGMAFASSFSVLTSLS